MNCCTSTEKLYRRIPANGGQRPVGKWNVPKHNPRRAINRAGSAATFMDHVQQRLGQDSSPISKADSLLTMEAKIIQAAAAPTNPIRKYPSHQSAPSMRV